MVIMVLGTQGTARATPSRRGVDERGCGLEASRMLLTRLHALIAANLVWRSADLQKHTLADRNNPCFDAVDATRSQS
jgi:hypothetical protein